MLCPTAAPWTKASQVVTATKFPGIHLCNSVNWDDVEQIKSAQLERDQPLSRKPTEDSMVYPSVIITNGNGITNAVIMR